MKKVLFIFVVLAVLIVFFYFRLVILTNGNGDVRTEDASDSVVIETKKEQTEFICPIDELNWVDFDDRVLNSSNAVDLIKDNCHNLGDQHFLDVTNDGSEDIILDLFPYGCASCHAKYYAVIDGPSDEVLFYLYYGAVHGWAQLRNFRNDGFEIKHSFEWNTPLGEYDSELRATETVSVYTFNEKTKGFDETNTYTEPQSSYSLPN